LCNQFCLGTYSVEEATQDGTELEVQLTSVDLGFPISLLYKDVVFPEDNLGSVVKFSTEQ
jgi:hypothetical protein